MAGRHSAIVSTGTALFSQFARFSLSLVSTHVPTHPTPPRLCSQPALLTLPPMMLTHPHSRMPHDRASSPNTVHMCICALPDIYHRVIHANPLPIPCTYYAPSSLVSCSICLPCTLCPLSSILYISSINIIFRLFEAQAAPSPLRVGRIAHYTHAQHTPAEHASQNIFCLSISLSHSHSSFPVSQLPFVSLDDVVT